MSDFYLSLADLADYQARLNFDDLASEPKSKLARELHWWQDFAAFLRDTLTTEELYYSQHEDEYFMPLEEVVYVGHWRRQLVTADKNIAALMAFIRGQYGRKK